MKFALALIALLLSTTPATASCLSAADAKKIFEANKMELQASGYSATGHFFMLMANEQGSFAYVWIAKDGKSVCLKDSGNQFKAELKVGPPA